MHLLEGRISDPRHSVGLQLAEWRSATEVADRCIETVLLLNIPSDLRRAQAPRAKFDLLFEALGEIIVDVQRQTLDAETRCAAAIRIHAAVVEVTVSADRAARRSPRLCDPSRP